MDGQTLIDLVGGTVLTCIGWWCRQICDSVQMLKDDVKQIEIDLPTNYVKKNDMTVRFDRIEVLLDKLYEKLEQKADK